MADPEPSTGSEPSNKRRRNLSESPPAEISRHDSTLYFENGNIVLLSLPTENIITAFKVYKDFLVLYSPVFEAMLSMPCPPDMEKYDDVPLVHLHDKAADLVPFLKLLYDHMTMPSKQDFYHSFNKVESIFKLSKKYQCDKFLKHLQGTFTAIWPVDLLTWDSIRKKRRVITRYKNQKELESGLPEPCSAIYLARNYDVPAILPAAFYHLLSTSPRAVPDNGLAGPKANFTVLSHHDVLCFVRGSYMIRQFVNRLYQLARSDMKKGKYGCDTFNACYWEFCDLLIHHKETTDFIEDDALVILTKSTA